MEFIKDRCRTTSGRRCDFCSSHGWKSPKLFQGIHARYPDYSKLPKFHYKDVFDTTMFQADNTNREVDDYLPRAQLKKQFYDGSISLDKPENIEEFCKKYIVEENYVREYVNHLLTLQRSNDIRQNQRKNDKRARKAKQYWNGLASSYEKLNKLYTDEVVKCLKYHKLLLMGYKKDKIMRIVSQVNRSEEDNIVRQCEDEESDYEDEDYDNDEENDDGRDEVVTLV